MMAGAISATMAQAAQVTGPGVAALVGFPLADPGAGQIRVRLEGCGVCASNLGPWAGPAWMRFPLAPGELGHEAWGRIDAVGPGVAAFRPGDRVAYLGTHGYATHETVPAAAAVRLPPSLDAQPVPAEPLGCAMMIFERAGIAAGDRVAIFGLGFLGVVLTALSVAAGARVVAVSRREDARALALRAGAEAAVAPDGGDGPDTFVPGGCDVAIECAGHQAPLDQAARALREGGRLVIAGYHQDGPRQVDMQLWNWRALRIVNAHERDREVMLAALRRGIDAVAAGRIDLAPLLTHRYKLAELGTALDATRDKPRGFVKALVVME